VAAYAERYRASWALFDDVLPCLRQLSRYTLGVISNGSAEQQRRKLIETGIDGFFSYVFISEELRAAKPRAAVFSKACQIARRKPEDCIYIGDRLDSDALSSTRAGLRGIWLNREASPVNGAIEVISSLGELPDRLQFKSNARRSTPLPAVMTNGSARGYVDLDRI
jgi:putative hydrolase of the HAD superfamily